MNLKDIAQAHLAVLALGHYTNTRGQRVDFGAAQAQASQGTRLCTPAQLNALQQGLQPAEAGASLPADLQVRVVKQSTQVAAQRMVAAGADSLVLLNFASARHAGGGFITGARAQEEDLCRCSGLYPCIITQPAYLDVNRRQDSLLYTDHMLHSPRVPWLRTEGTGPLLDEVFLASVITAPAPNAGQYLAHGQGGWDEVQACLLRRCGQVLALAKAEGHRQLLLGAWGCGVFRNQPAMVADAFARWLAAPAYAQAFECVEFAVLDRSREQANVQAFTQRLTMA